MVRPYDMDLRERVVAAVSAGESRRSAARRFGVSESVAVKWLQRVDPTSAELTLADLRREPTIYLLLPYDTEEEALTDVARAMLAGRSAGLAGRSIDDGNEWKPGSDAFDGRPIFPKASRLRCRTSASGS